MRNTSSTGHDYHLAEIVWNGYTPYEVYICKNNSEHRYKVECKVDVSINSKPTCVQKGQRIYTAVSEIYSAKVENLPIDSSNHNLYKYTAITANCYYGGRNEYYECLSCGKYFSDEKGINEIDENSWIVDALEHDYIFESIEWTNLTAVAKYRCSRCWVREQYDCIVTSKILKESTCSSKGELEYTATYENHSDISIRYLEIDENAHDYVFDKIIWNGFTATARYKCQNSSYYAVHYLSHDCVVNSFIVSKPAENNPGIQTYTAKYEDYTSTKTNILPYYPESLTEVQKYAIDVSYEAIEIAEYLTHDCDSAFEKKISVFPYCDSLSGYQMIKDFTLKLIDNCKTDEEKCLTIYSWIGNNIRYDEDYGNCDIEESFFIRAGVCNQFAGLMHDMLSAAGIQSFYIGGLRAYTSTLESTINGRNHAWLIAKVNGTWKFYDPTTTNGEVNMNLYAMDVYKAVEFGRTPQYVEEIGCFSDRLDLSLLQNRSGNYIVYRNENIYCYYNNTLSDGYNVTSYINSMTIHRSYEPDAPWNRHYIYISDDKKTDNISVSCFKEINNSLFNDATTFIDNFKSRLGTQEAADRLNTYFVFYTSTGREIEPLYAINYLIGEYGKEYVNAYVLSATMFQVDDNNLYVKNDGELVMFTSLDSYDGVCKKHNDCSYCFRSLWDNETDPKVYAVCTCNAMHTIECCDIEYDTHGNVTKVSLPSNVTRIASEAFCWGDFSQLKTIHISNNVTYIGEYAIYNIGVVSIYYNGTMEQWNAIAKDSNWNSNTGDYVIHCTDGDISK